MEYAMLPQTKESLTHILKQYSNFKGDRRERGLAEIPMIVGVSGCQGSGKTTLCNTLSYLLKQEPYHLNVVSFSLDDVYLKRQDQIELSRQHPNNILYRQRGQAGSHDINLALETLKSLKLNQSQVSIPVYDKSLSEGQGDRLPETQWKRVSGPFDIVLFEGWMMGFKPLPVQELEKVYCSKKSTVQAFKYLTLEDVTELNEALRRYELELYPHLNTFIHLSPLDINQVYRWRLEQEQHMKSTRGVSGLSDDAVKKFVDTYMPAYELYLPQLDNTSLFDGRNKESGLHLKISLDPERKVVQSSLLAKKIKTRETIYRPAKWSLGPKGLLFAGTFMLIGYIGYKPQKIFDAVFCFYNRFNKK